MQQIGDYELKERIGAGGMGEVWLAQNVHTRLRYAVKLLPREATSDRNFVARFFDEGRVMAELDHPRIVRVHHVGQDEASGRHFLVMDFVAGPEGRPQSLHDLLAASADSRLPEAQVREWAVQIAEGLAYAHEHGVIHRDIKPANILLDKDGNVRITDFGLAKAIGEEFVRTQIHQSIRHSLRGTLSDTPTLAPESAPSAPAEGDNTHGSQRSTTASILGTYDYMSPEQRGDLPGVLAGPSSDIYSLGVMLYRLLTGRRPVGRTREVSTLVPGVGRWWDEVIDRCIEHNPSDRIKDGQALLACLRGVPAGSRRRTRKVLVLSLCGVVVVVGIGLLFSVVRRDSRQQDAPVARESAPAPVAPAAPAPKPDARQKTAQTPVPEFSMAAFRQSETWKQLEATLRLADPPKGGAIQYEFQLPHQTPGDVSHVACSPGYRYLATFSEDHSCVKLWDMKTGWFLRQIFHLSAVAAEFVNDETLLVAARDGLEVYRLPDGLSQRTILLPAVKESRYKPAIKTLRYDAARELVFIGGKLEAEPKKDAPGAASASAVTAGLPQGFFLVYHWANRKWLQANADEITGPFAIEELGVVSDKEFVTGFGAGPNLYPWIVIDLVAQGEGQPKLWKVTNQSEAGKGCDRNAYWNFQQGGPSNASLRFLSNEDSQQHVLTFVRDIDREGTREIEKGVRITTAENVRDIQILSDKRALIQEGHYASLWDLGSAERVARVEFCPEQTPWFTRALWDMCKGQLYLEFCRFQGRDLAFADPGIFERRPDYRKTMDWRVGYFRVDENTLERTVAQPASGNLVVSFEKEQARTCDAIHTSEEGGFCVAVCWKRIRVFNVKSGAAVVDVNLPLKAMGYMQRTVFSRDKRYVCLVPGNMLVMPSHIPLERNKDYLPDPNSLCPVLVYSLETGKMVYRGTLGLEMDGNKGEITRVAFSPDGRFLAAAVPGKHLAVVDLQTGEIAKVWRANDISAVGFVGERTLAVGCQTGGIDLIDVDTKRVEMGVAKSTYGPVLDIRTALKQPDLIVTTHPYGVVTFWKGRHLESQFNFVALPQGQWFAFTPAGWFACSDKAEPYVRAFQNKKPVPWADVKLVACKPEWFRMTLGGADYYRALASRDNAAGDDLWDMAEFIDSLGDKDSALACRAKAVEGMSAVDTSHVSTFTAAMDRGDYPLAHKLASLLSTKGANDHMLQNDLAWKLATWHDARGCAPEQAIEYAKRACDLAKATGLATRYLYLDTLAAAWAARGDFKQAVEFQQEALNLCPKDISSSFSERLNLYNAGHAYVEDKK